MSDQASSLSSEDAAELERLRNEVAALRAEVELGRKLLRASMPQARLAEVAAYLDRRRSLDAEQAELCLRISSTIELAGLLGILGEQIERLGVFDGYMICLADTDSQELVCHKVRLPAGFQGMEPAYQGLRIGLTQNDPLVRAYRANQTVCAAAAAFADDPGLRPRFEHWRIAAIAVLPIRRGGQAIGTVFGFRQQGDIDGERLRVLEERLPLFSEQIRNALFFSELKRRELEIEAAAAARQRFLNFVDHVTELRDLDQIYEVITREFLTLLPFDIAGVVMREGQRLVVKKNTGRDGLDPALLNAWTEYYRHTSYDLDPADGATAFAYCNDTRVMIPDVKRILHLPMSAKDRRALEIMGTPRTFLFVPIRRQDEAVGVLWLLSASEVVPVSKPEIELVEALCSIIGTSIGNAQLYTTVERQRREIESALAQLQRAQEQLARAKEAAEASAAAKSAFVANTSHEIRTPLTAIIGFAEGLLDEAPPGSSAAHAASVILRNGRQLLALINDILDLSKIEAGRLEFEAVPFSTLELLLDVRETVAQLARDKRLRFSLNLLTPLPSQICGDPARLRQALLNLCNNAVKFTNVGGVDLDVSYEDQWLVIRVRDTGIGIRPADVERLFAPFTQADASVTRRFGGTGLGLTITRELVKGMGGSLQFMPNPGGGSIFEVRIPTGAVDGVEWLLPDAVVHSGRWLPHDAPPEPVPALSGKVLVAEDGIDNQQLIRIYLERAGAEVTVVQNGRDAVVAALTTPFDLVLMDIQMPVMSGLDAVGSLRRSGYTGPVVALTANVMADDVARYRNGGFDDCLGKPIDRSTFYRTLRQYLKPRAQAVIARPIDVSDLMARFSAELPARIAEFEELVRCRDWQRLAIEAHKLKGSAGALGWPRLGDLAGEIERMVKQQPESEERAAALAWMVRQARTLVTAK